jgi:hypothetical protein
MKLLLASRLSDAEIGTPGEWSLSVEEADSTDILVTFARGDQRRAISLYIGHDGYPRVGILDERAQDRIYTVRLNGQIAIKRG